MTIYTDGACRGNQETDNIGAYAFVAISDTGEELVKYKQVSRNTTNNIMELRAVIAALLWIQHEYKGPEEIHTIVSDSQYVVKGITEWISGWKRNSWKGSSGPVKNKELWMQMDALNGGHIQWKWVRGHDGNIYNEMVDTLCNIAMDEYNKDRKPTVYIAWDRAKSDLAEFGLLPDEEYEQVTFNTTGEAEAYMRGIGDAQGWDSPFYKLIQ